VREEAEPAHRRPFWATFTAQMHTAQMHALPEEVFERLPKDGASEVDHYLYGAPKTGEITGDISV